MEKFTIDQDKECPIDVRAYTDEVILTSLGSSLVVTKDELFELFRKLFKDKVIKDREV